MPSTWTNLFFAVEESFVKDEKKPEVSIVGAAFDVKNFLKDRLPDMSKWTDNLCYRFAKNLVSGDVETHYKFFGKSPHYCGAFHDERVKNFKQLARELGKWLTSGDEFILS